MFRPVTRMKTRQQVSAKDRHPSTRLHGDISHKRVDLTFTATTVKNFKSHTHDKQENVRFHLECTGLSSGLVVPERHDARSWNSTSWYPSS